MDSKSDRSAYHVEDQPEEDLINPVSWTGEAPDADYFQDPRIPHAPEDERYVIGVALAFQKAAIEIVAKLQASEIYTKICNRAFRAIEAIVDRGEAPTIHAVSLEQKRQAEEANPDDKDNPFNYASDFELTAAFDRNEYKDIRGIPGAVGRIKRAAMYREIRLAARKAEAMAMEAKEDPEVILEVFDQANSAVLEKKRKGIAWADGEAGREAEETYDRLQKGELVTVPSGLPELDEVLYGNGFWGGDVIVLAGVTSGGKTTLALNFGDNAASMGLRNVVFTLEMKTFKLFSRLHSAKALLPAYKIRPRMDDQGEGIRARLRDTMDRVTRLPIGFVDWATDITTIRRVAKDAVHRKGARLLIIDYAQLVRPPKGFKGSTYEKTTEVSRQIKETALELDVPIILLSQLRRKYKEEKSEGNEVEPSVDMLKESGGLENDADTIIFIWGEKGNEGETQALRDIKCRVAKQRQGVSPSKIIPLRFAPEIFTFKSVRQLEEAARKAEEKAGNSWKLEQ